jgi:hypothetical protein
VLSRTPLAWVASVSTCVRGARDTRNARRAGTRGAAIQAGVSARPPWTEYVGAKRIDRDQQDVAIRALVTNFRASTNSRRR